MTVKTAILSKEEETAAAARSVAKARSSGKIRYRVTAPSYGQVDKNGIPVAVPVDTLWVHGLPIIDPKVGKVVFADSGSIKLYEGEGYCYSRLQAYRIALDYPEYAVVRITENGDEESIEPELGKIREMSKSPKRDTDPDDED